MYTYTYYIFCLRWGGHLCHFGFFTNIEIVYLYRNRWLLMELGECMSLFNRDIKTDQIKMWIYLFVDMSDCGISIHDEAMVSSRISKGSEAPPGMYPWHVTFRTRGVCNFLHKANNTRLNLFSKYFKSFN
jgi:hypothetical protein